MTNQSWYIYYPDSKEISARYWLSIGCVIGPTSAADIGPPSFCSSGRYHADFLARCWADIGFPTANRLPTACQYVLYLGLHWADIGQWG